MEANCLSDREKFIAVERLRANQMGIVSREWRWDHVWETIYDFKTWSWFFLIISISLVSTSTLLLSIQVSYFARRIPSGGISSFGNLILESFGYTNFQSILFNLPLGVIQIIAILGGGWLATRFRTKGLVIVLFATLASIGTILLLVVPRSNKGVLLFGYYLVRRIITHLLSIDQILLTLTRCQPWLPSHLWFMPGKLKILQAIRSESAHQLLSLWGCAQEM